MPKFEASRAFFVFLGVGLFAIAFSAVVVSATIHPLAGLALVLAIPGLGILAQHEFAAVRAYVFLIVIVPLYLRLPGLSLLSPMILFFLALLAIVLLRVLLQAERLLWSSMHSLALFYIVVVLLSSISPHFSPLTLRLIYYPVLLPIGSFLLVFYTVKDARDVQHLLDAITIAAVVAAVYSFLEYFLQRNWLIEKFLLPTESSKFDIAFFYFSKDELANVYRTFSTFENPIEFATFLGMVFFYPVLAVIYYPSRVKRAFYAIATVLILFALILTFSRLAWISAAAVGFFLLVRERAARRLLLLVTVVGVVAIAVLYPLYATEIQERVFDSATLDTRLGMYRLAFLMFLDHPFMGVGYYNFGNYSLEYASRYGAGEFRFPLELFQMVDSTYFQMLCEMGLLGLITHLAILITFFLCCARLAKRGGAIGLQATAVGLGVLVYAVNGLASLPMHFSAIVTQIFWIYIGLAFRLAALQQDNEIHSTTLRLEPSR